MNFGKEHKKSVLFELVYMARSTRCLMLYDYANTFCIVCQSSSLFQISYMLFIIAY